MEILDHLILGFSVAGSLTNLLYCFVGVFVGRFGLAGRGILRTSLGHGCGWRRAPRQRDLRYRARVLCRSQQDVIECGTLQKLC